MGEMLVPGGKWPLIVEGMGIELGLFRPCPGLYLLICFFYSLNLDVDTTTHIKNFKDLKHFLRMIKWTDVVGLYATFKHEHQD